MVAMVQMAASLTPRMVSLGALLGTGLDFWGTNSGGLSQFHPSSRQAALNLWIDYPLAVTAGCIALSVLGTGGVGTAVFASFCLLPLTFKVTVMCAEKNSSLGKVALRLNSMARVVVKAVNTIAFFQFAKAAPTIELAAWRGTAAFLMMMDAVLDLGETPMHPRIVKV